MVLKIHFIKTRALKLNFKILQRSRRAQSTPFLRNKSPHRTLSIIRKLTLNKELRVANAVRPNKISCWNTIILNLNSLIRAEIYLIATLA